MNKMNNFLVCDYIIQVVVWFSTCERMRSHRRSCVVRLATSISTELWPMFARIHPFFILRGGEMSGKKLA